MKGRVLIVAGSDSGGGAGIQADIKTVTMQGAFAATAITALTAQNTLGRFRRIADRAGLHPAADRGRARRYRRRRDQDRHAARTAVIETVAAVLAERAPEDAAGRRSGHGRERRRAADRTVGDRRAKGASGPRAAVLTPNLPEAEILAGRSIESLRAKTCMRPTGRKSFFLPNLASLFPPQACVRQAGRRRTIHEPGPLSRPPAWCRSAAGRS